MQNPNKKVYDSLKYLSLISQIGISVITPCLLCILGALWLRSKFNLGDWVIILGILFGLAGGIVSISKYAKMALRDARKSEKELKDKYK